MSMATIHPSTEEQARGRSPREIRLPPVLHPDLWTSSALPNGDDFAKFNERAKKRKISAPPAFTSVANGISSQRDVRIEVSRQRP